MIDTKVTLPHAAEQFLVTDFAIATGVASGRDEVTLPNGARGRRGRAWLREACGFDDVLHTEIDGSIAQSNPGQRYCGAAPRIVLNGDASKFSTAVQKDGDTETQILTFDNCV